MVNSRLCVLVSVGDCSIQPSAVAGIWDCDKPLLRIPIKLVMDV